MTGQRADARKRAEHRPAAVLVEIPIVLIEAWLDDGDPDATVSIGEHIAAAYASMVTP